MRPLSAVILAAGEGTRMRSTRPKPLHRLCGRPMVLHVLDALVELDIERAVMVIGHAADRVSKALGEQAPPGLALEFVEQRDATDEEAAIDEVNVGIYVFRRSLLAPTLRRLTPANAQGEYYLTDTIQVLALAGYKVGSMVMDDPIEGAGVNDRAQLAAAEAELRDRINERWMRRGVTMIDPERTYLDTTVELAPDVCLYPGTILQGRTTVGAGAEVGPDTRLVDCQVGSWAVVEHVVGRQAAVGAGARVGPYVVLQPGSSVAADVVTGSHLVVNPDA